MQKMERIIKQNHFLISNQKEMRLKLLTIDDPCERKDERIIPKLSIDAKDPDISDVLHDVENTNLR